MLILVSDSKIYHHLVGTVQGASVDDMLASSLEKFGSFGAALVIICGAIYFLVKFAFLPLAQIYRDATENQAKAATAHAVAEQAHRDGTEAMARAMECAGELTKRLESMWNKILEKVD